MRRRRQAQRERRQVARDDLTLDALVRDPKLTVPFLAAGPFALGWVEIHNKDWASAGAYFALTLLTAVALMSLYRRLRSVAANRTLLTYLYWFSLPLNVTLVVALGSEFSFWPTAGALTLFVSAFFAGVYAVTEEKSDDENRQQIDHADDHELADPKPRDEA